MNTSFFICLGLTFAFLGLLQGMLEWMVHSSRFAPFRLRTPGANYLGPQKKWRNVAFNSSMGLLSYLGFLYYLGDAVLYPQVPAIAHLLGEVLAVLLIYDGIYYFYHRVMHHPRLMKFVHGTHHKVRFPVASESNFLNPLEQIGAFVILLGAMVVLGPISEAAFLLIVLLHGSINIIVHSNLVFPHPAFRLFNFWVQKHDVHHDTFRSNYASIFPFWDQAFGTFK